MANPSALGAEDSPFESEHLDFSNDFKMLIEIIHSCVVQR